MIANAIFAVVAVAVFLLLCVVGWYLVQLLRQLRLTAMAMEQFLTSARPQLEATTAELRSLLGRADRFFAAAEEGSSGAGNILGTIGQALAGWAAGSRAVATISATVAALVQAWSIIGKGATAPDPRATPEEGA